MGYQIFELKDANNFHHVKNKMLFNDAIAFAVRKVIFKNNTIAYIVKDGIDDEILLPYKWSQNPGNFALFGAPGILMANGHAAKHKKGCLVFSNLKEVQSFLEINTWKILKNGIYNKEIKFIKK